MGLFTQRPQHNEEWAGLPSEPLDPESPAERLTGSPPAPGLLGADSGMASIAIPLPTAQPETPADDPRGAGGGGERD